MKTATKQPKTKTFNKKAFVKRMTSLEVERNKMLPYWKVLRDLIRPFVGKFEDEDNNKSHDKQRKIVNSIATLALRTASSGIMSGLTSPAKPWFNLSINDEKISKSLEVREWLDEVEKIINATYSKSNLYTELPKLYQNILLFGTGAIAQLEDRDNIVRFYSYPIGECIMANGEDGKINVFYRKYNQTVAQMVEKFGFDNCSEEVQKKYKDNNMEEVISIINCIEPNDNRIIGMVDNKNFAFRSVHYEEDAKDNNKEDSKALLISGFYEFPIHCPRWETEGDEVYGSCPAMDALGDIKQLQSAIKSKSKMLEKIVNPPMIASASMRKAGLDLRAGHINYFDDRNNVGQDIRLESIYKPSQQPFNEMKEMERELENRINKVFFADLFLGISNIERSGVTATEIQERIAEKMLQLGSVVQRFNNELLDPLVDRTFNILLRGGKLPQAPEVLRGMEIKVEYTSVLHQAQKSAGLSNIERVLGFVSQVMQVEPTAIDKIDFDAMIDQYSNMAGVPASIIRGGRDVEKIRQAHQEQQEQQQKMQQAEQGVNMAKSLSEGVRNMEGVGG